MCVSVLVCVCVCVCASVCVCVCVCNVSGAYCTGKLHLKNCPQHEMIYMCSGIPHDEYLLSPKLIERKNMNMCLCKDEMVRYHLCTVPLRGFCLQSAWTVLSWRTMGGAYVRSIH